MQQPLKSFFQCIENYWRYHLALVIKIIVVNHAQEDMENAIKKKNQDMKSVKNLWPMNNFLQKKI